MSNKTPDSSYVPKGWNSISPALHYRDAKKMIDWLCAAFGLQLRLLVEDDEGGVAHSELSDGIGIIQVSSEKVIFGVDCRSPMSLQGKCTQSNMLYVRDVDAHHQQAVAQGAEIISPVSVHDYGEEYWSDRSYGVRDPEGHFWWFTQRMRTGATV